MASLFDKRDYADTMNSPVREIKLSIKDPSKKDSTMGMIDPAVIKGDNKFFAIMDEYGNWSFRYKQGTLPEGLSGKFTAISKALHHAKIYFEKRNIEVTEVKDVHAT